MSDDGAYKKEDLEKILSSCIAMSTLDGEIHIDELQPVVKFIEGRWQGDYGDINQMMGSAQKGAGELLKSSSLTESIGGIAGGLSGSLDQAQKDAVLELLKEVLHADGEGHEMEHAMYDIFVKKF
ncbi:MAG: TerB family tellurite resistance protein [Thermodesulfovibrionales bacterium]|nr:TerB family tellurite resistance protein [Thermodesulfovibrionales bacterium]